MGFKTCYVGHDNAYRKMRERGQPGWDSSEEAYGRFFGQYLELLASCKVPLSGNLLELGCGAGNFTLRFSGIGFEVNGIDIAPTAVEWAKERARESGLEDRFREGDVLDLKEFGEGTFDLVFDGHCLHCIIGDDRPKLLSEVRRVLKPEGFFLVDTMCGTPEPGTIEGYDPVSRHILCTADRFKGSRMEGVAQRYIGLPDVLLEELKAGGFEILGHRIRVEPENKGCDGLIALARKSS